MQTFWLMTLILLPIAFVFFVILTFGYYFLYIKPQTVMSRFAIDAKSHGYKTKLLPFQFLKYYIAKYFSQDEFSLKVLKQDWSKYDIIVGNIFSQLGIMIGKPQLIKDVCNQINKFEKSPFVSQVFRKLNGGGIVFTEGQVWKRKRRIISSIFHYDFLNSMIPTIENEIEHSFNKIDQQIKQGANQFNLRQVFTKILSNVVTKCFFGTDMKDYQIQGKSYCDYYIEFLDDIGKFLPSQEHMFFGMKCYDWKLTERCRSLRKKYELLQNIAKEITEKEIEKIKNHQEKNKNILTALYENNMLNLQGNQNQNQYTMFELIGEFFAFFAAGTDTTSNTINLVLHYLSENPQWVQKIRNQIQEVNKLKLETSQKLKQLKICEAIFNQTLRINGPAAMIITRRTLEDLTIGQNLKIKKGTYVSVSLLLCHYREQNYSNPDKFMPERWLSEKKIEPFGFIPFSGGQRNCIGQYLARIEAKLLLSKICQRYEFKSIHPIKMIVQFVYATKEGTFQLRQIQQK